MNNLLTAIMTKCTGSALSTAVGGRIFLDEAPEGSEFPYVVFSIISGTPQDTFSEKIEETLIQFSLYSISSGAAEITAMYAALKTLLDGQLLTITDNTCIWVMRQNLTTMIDEITTPSGTFGAKHWDAGYSIMGQKT